MRRDKKIMIAFVLIFGVSLFLSFEGLVADKQILGIPMINELSCIEIYGDYLNDITNYQVFEGGSNDSNL